MHCEFCNGSGHTAHDCDEFHRAQAVAAETITLTADDYAAVDAIIGARRSLTRYERDCFDTWMSGEG